MTACKAGLLQTSELSAQRAKDLGPATQGGSFGGLSCNGNVVGWRAVGKGHRSRRKQRAEDLSYNEPRILSRRR
jgi:hypothetical protein